MIKVGDKFKDELKEWTVCEVYRGAALAFSGNITREFSKQYIYTIMYLEQKQRADELENKLAYIKSHLNDLWHNGDATEHEYAYNTLKYIESLQENDND